VTTLYHYNTIPRKKKKREYLGSTACIQSMSFYLFGLIEMVVAQYLFLGSQVFKGREDEDGL